MARRSSSEPRKCPPCALERQVMMTGLRRPARAAAALGSRTVSRRSSIRSASMTSSRRVRSSAVVSAVTVTHSLAGLKRTPVQQVKKRHKIKKRLFVSEEALRSSVRVYLVLYTDRLASPIGHQYHHAPYDTDPAIDVNPVEATARKRI